MAILRHRLAVAGLCILLVVAGLLIAQTAGPAAESSGTTMHWVRARDGWRIANWERTAPARHPAVHPGLLAAFIALGSVTALIAFSSPPPGNFDSSDPSSSNPAS